MLSFLPKDLETPKLHNYLLSAVAPRPIAFASTVDKDGRPNLSPFSFFNVFSANPPILIFSPARRVRGNTTKHTLENVEVTNEVVINVVNYDIVQQMSLSSTEYPEGVNEFEKAGLTMLKSDIVKPFRVAESPIQMECKVNEIVKLGTEGGAGNLVICEVVKMHINDEVLDENGAIDQVKLDLVSRAGGSFYSRAKSGFFEIPKPLRTLGIGVDALPEHVKNSNILTGNDLGLLANVETLPTEDAILAFKQKHDLSKINLEEKHKKAQGFLSYNDVESAWKMLLL
ncbi:flavin reductase (DIM6/NTAB) family NADH-FMN oxidoreductase RutF [Mesoflavibacter sabulilitoris]|uniref:Flavin reductase n=1 Tax=Mesoflavibacter zeaxanthinifaciens subsp. sabulilitoris TaxID=1520893 RepID=A0A2T1N759_9FLAO|nr:flavin reductase family protein [Mesoflavibacter zeaxanthinifaciens]MBB3124127.1 flavin reductase (DIM6/NTAB) family NADH-FMN oxidoreductase RutF [Mesoflavibacter zeaxanthinifaciens subsp. sabulilitoris]PSG87710.1 flavin reductase [Mesoflavibacter zeaxanthinifaciens subsp. sabulilitoris]